MKKKAKLDCGGISVKEIFNKVKKCVMNNKYKISREFKWTKKYLTHKYPFVLSIIKQTISTFLFGVICYLAVLMFFIQSEIIVINNTIVFDYTKSFGEYISMTSIITTQVSVSLMVVSISSLIANIENKYVYGKRALDLVFHKRGPFSFKVFMITLFSLNFVNIYFLINQIGDAAIITVFILAVLLVAYFVYRFVGLFIGQVKIKRNLMNRYYKENIKHLKNAKPLNAHPSADNENFKNVTLKYIKENNIPIYRENIDVYFTLLDITLFNHKKLVQEYYTEHITHSDFVAHIISFAQDLLLQNKIFESIRLYNKLFTVLNYYQVVNVSNIHIINMSSRYIKAIKSISNEVEIQDYCYLVNQLIDNIFYQVFLYTKVDLSYCRLYKDKLIHFNCFNDLLEMYYEAIYENKYLNNLEKARIYDNLFDYVRMTEFSEKHPNYNIEDFINKEYIPKNADVYPIEIKAEPIAMMILKMFENQDFNNLKMFLKMNVSTRLGNAIKTMVLLSITEILNNGNKRKFVMDLDVDENFAIINIGINKMLNLNLHFEDMIELYKLLIEKYTISDSEYVSGSLYGFCPKFKFSKNVVDTYFLHIMEKVHKDDNFKKVIQEEIQKDEKVNAILNSYYKTSIEK